MHFLSSLLAILWLVNGMSLSDSNFDIGILDATTAIPKKTSGKLKFIMSIIRNVFTIKCIVTL